MQTLTQPFCSVWHLKNYFNLFFAHSAKEVSGLFKLIASVENRDEMVYIGVRLERVHKLRDVYNSEECWSQHNSVKRRKLAEKPFIPQKKFMSRVE